MDTKTNIVRIKIGKPSHSAFKAHPLPLKSNRAAQLGELEWGKNLCERGLKRQHAHIDI